MTSNDTSPAGSAPNGHDDSVSPSSPPLSFSSPLGDVQAAARADSRSPEQHTTSSGSRGPTSAPASRASIDAHGRALNPRSCVTCRRRKVKCDKTHPCANCTRARIQCIYPSPGRAPRKSRKQGEHGRDADLLDRLRRLEGVVKGMGVEVPGAVPDHRARGEIDGLAGLGTARQGRGASDSGVTVGQSGPAPNVDPMRWDDTITTRPAASVEALDISGFETRFGRLVVNEGKSRYINNSFWASLNTEVEDLKGLLNQSSDEDDDVVQEVDPHPNNHQGWIFGFNSASIDILALHPSPDQIPLYWEAYKDRVDLLAKVLHIPTIEPTVLSAASHLSNLSKGFEALLFAIYYASTTSLTPEECLSRFGENKPVLLARYRFAIEQALARANFLLTEEVVVLQAFVIFLVCLRRNTDGRVIWTLTGLIVRIAQTMGIHRDGTHFSLKPFDVEIRRRLWWQACILDVRASEDHGCDPTIVEHSFDTRMPLNVNDADITPDMEAFPPERIGFTEMSFCLVRFEVSHVFRRINYNPPQPGGGRSDSNPDVTPEDKERWITESQQKLENKYLKYGDMNVPLYWVTKTVARLMMSKMWLMAYHPFHRQKGVAGLSQDTYEKLFITSLENIEYSVMLESEVVSMKWGWLFRTYMQWHALAFLLTALCKRTTGDMVARAWLAVDKIHDGRLLRPNSADAHAGVLWRPLRKLYHRAREARETGLREEALSKVAPWSPPTSDLPPRRTYSPNANPMFGHPARPQPTRAPLSHAQLRRFTEGPIVGTLPQVRAEMLGSSRGSDAGMGDAPPDAGDSATAYTHPFVTYPTNGRHYTAPTTLAGASNLPAQSVPPPFDPAVFAPVSLGDVLGQQPVPTGNSLDADPSALMDTSGDLDWDSWDQLVRQFGMDVDGGAPAPAATAAAAADWPVGDLDDVNAGMLSPGGAAGLGVPTTPNMRMGMGTGTGMGMGDWF